MNKINFENIPKVLYRIGQSKIINGEIGLIAVRDIGINSIIAPFEIFKDDNLCPWGEFKKLDIETQDFIKDYCVSSDEGWSLPDNLNYISIPWHMNHSCDCNVGFDEKNNFIAIKNIKGGDELTWDYGFADMGERFSMQCLCGSDNCRKMIKGDDYKKFIGTDLEKYLMK